MDELLTVEVSVETTGEAEGVKSGGGVLEVILRTLEIECLPGDLPEAITVDVSALNIGDSIHVGALSLPEGRDGAQRRGSDRGFRRGSDRRRGHPRHPPPTPRAQPEVINEKKPDTTAPTAS